MKIPVKIIRSHSEIMRCSVVLVRDLVVEAKTLTVILL